MPEPDWMLGLHLSYVRIYTYICIHTHTHAYIVGIYSVYKCAHTDIIYFSDLCASILISNLSLLKQQRNNKPEAITLPNDLHPKRECLMHIEDAQ